MLVAETWVVSDAPHFSKLPSAKSLSCAVVECDERVAPRNVEKHWSLPSTALRSMPASNSSSGRMAVEALLSRNGHAWVGVSVVRLTTAQKFCDAPARAQSPLALSASWVSGFLPPTHW